MSQLVLSETVLAAPRARSIHTLLVPVACAVVSVVVLLLHVVLSLAPVKRFIAKLRGREPDEVNVDSVSQQPVIRQHTSFFPDLRSHIKAHGG
ncbi:unnamed protein product, partial [Rhizoctonia solani]